MQTSLRKLALLAASTFVTSTALLGCIPNAEMIDEDAENGDQGQAAYRRVLVCQQGLSDRTTGWDKGLFDLCEAAEASGIELVWDGDYPAFGALDENGAYNALFDELDENGDGIVNGKDTPVAVHLVGFSWGGINVTDIAERLRTDARIIPARRGVSVMVLLDAFQPQISRARIPSNVFRAWVYRQTDTTEGDCSTTASLGFGFNGHRPKAKNENTHCSMYDLDGFLEGVGHCDVPTVAKDAALHNLTQRTDYAPWADHAADCPLD